MTTLDAILARIRRRRAGRTPPPPPPAWQGRDQYTDPAATLAAQLERNGAQVQVVPDAGSAVAAIAALFEELAPRRVVMNPDPCVTDLGLPERFPGIDWSIAGEMPREVFREACAAAEIGISGAVSALAETGSVVVESGPARSRLVTLLPPVSLIVVEASSIVPDIFAWTARRASAVPANVVFISGPSKSADIEQTLAVGVHGPGRLIVLVRLS